MDIPALLLVGADRQCVRWVTFTAAAYVVAALICLGRGGWGQNTNPSHPLLLADIRFEQNVAIGEVRPQCSVSWR